MRVAWTLMLLYIGVFAAGLMLGAMLCPAHAQGLRPGDHGYRHRENHENYQRYMPNCCSSGECRETIARWEPGGWKAVVDGEWREVPANAVRQKDGVPQLSFDGKAHICAAPVGLKTIWCFLAPDTET